MRFGLRVPLSVVGKLLGDATIFNQVKNGEKVTLERFDGR